MKLQLIFLLLTLIAISSSTNTKSDRDIDMDMYKNLERDNQSDLSEIDNLHNNFDDSNNSFLQKPNKSKSKKGKKIRIRRRKAFKDPMEVLKSGWLKISSTMFSNTEKFPLITLPDYSEVKIKCNNNYFRINNAFDPKNSSKESPPSKIFIIHKKLVT